MTEEEILKMLEANQQEIESDITPNLEASGLMEQVIEREYSKDPLATLDKVTNATPKQVQETAPTPVVKEETPKKGIFNFYQPKPVDLENKIEFKETTETPLPNYEQVNTMTFEEPISELPLSAQDTVKAKIGSTTSDFIWRNFKNGFPEVIGNYVVKVDESIADTTFLPKDLTVAVKEEIAKRNAENKAKLEIPQWHEDNILPVLEQFCIEKGIQTSIPVGLQLAIGVIFLIGLFAIPTIMEIKKANNTYISRLEALFEQHKPKPKKEVEETES